MKTPEDTPRTPAWPRRLQIAVPLALGLGLVIAFVALLYQLSRERPVSSDPAVSVAEPTPAELDTPTGPAPQEAAPVTALKPPPKAAPLPASLKRWRIHPLPEGWDPEVAARIAELFGRVDYDPDDPETYLDAERALRELEEYLATLGPESLPTLSAILGAEQFFINRRRVLLAIGALGPESEDATWILRDFFIRRVTDPQRRSELNYAIKSMAFLQNETSFDVLTRLIENDDSHVASYRPELVRALGDHPRREEAKGLLVDTMFEGEQANSRNLAAQALKKIATPDLLPQLQEAFDREPYLQVRQTILGAMGSTGSPTALPFLEDVARLSKEREIRLSAARAIWRIGSPRAMAILDEIIHTEPDDAIRSRMVAWVR